MAKPIVALVGRPNVGKSTLFNRLVGERLAVVDDVPGTTRDRNMAEAEWLGYHFWVIDTGGIDPSQTGPGRSQQPLSVGSAEFVEEIRAQAEAAIHDADVVLMITDAESGITPADREVAEILRRNQREVNGQMRPPVFLVVNKSDSTSRRMGVYEFFELGLGTPYSISALHGTETGDLLDEVVKTFKSEQTQPEEDDSVKVAIVGRPNVGKSSLLNRLIGAERAIVSPIAGTTRDAIDMRLVYQDIPITLIDTAGIRRRGRIEPGVEKYSVLRSFQAIERSDVALLLLDATTGVTSQDAHIAGFVLESWKSVVVVVNKWDAIPKDTYTMDAFGTQVRKELNFLDYVPVLYISALTGQRVHQVLPMALRVQEERLARLSTSQINQVLQNAQAQHAAPSHTGRQLKIYYGTQVRSDPPTFLLYVNDPKLAHFSYLRFLENRLREAHGFLGTPIRIVLRSHHD